MSVFRLVHPLLARAPQAFGWTLTALDLHLSPPRELALIAEPDDDLARIVLARWDPNAVVAFGPRRGGPPARRQGASRRPADALRVRALRLPGAGDGDLTPG